MAKSHRTDEPDPFHDDCKLLAAEILEWLEGVNPPVHVVAGAVALVQLECARRLAAIYGIEPVAKQMTRGMKNMAEVLRELGAAGRVQ